MSKESKPVDLASGWSHDIRTHLHIIKGAVMMLDSGKLTQEKEKEYTGMIRHNVEIMEKLVNYILDQNKESTKPSREKTLPYQPKAVPLHQFIEKTIRSVVPFAAAKEICLLYDIEQQISAFCDLELLERILYNLLTNAIKHTEAGGVVYLSAYKKNAQVRIHIGDTGNGMNQEQLTDFAAGITSATGEGYGLRLVKMMMAQMYGQIACTSHKNMGTTFYLTIPGIACADCVVLGRNDRTLNA